MRLFVAIPLASSAQAELVALTNRLRPSASLRWSAPESWHVTLQFLGSVSEDQYRCLIPNLAAVQSAPFPMRLAGLGVFDRAGIFHADVDPSTPLMTLQRLVTTSTAACGFEAEARPYHPHITLARSKGRDQIRQLRALNTRFPEKPRFTPFVVTEFLLYESHLSASGSTYEVRSRFPLAGRGGK
jgi:RNA 2',3'-cyclic 3'-phosphodiesterase